MPEPEVGAALRRPGCGMRRRRRLGAATAGRRSGGAPAIVAPDLAACATGWNLLDDVLHPALIRPDAAEYPRCFNFFPRPAAGRSAADPRRPRLAGARRSRAKVEQARLSALLLAGGWSAAESRGRCPGAAGHGCAATCRIHHAGRRVVALAERQAAEALRLSAEPGRPGCLRRGEQRCAPRKLPPGAGRRFSAMPGGAGAGPANVPCPATTNSRPGGVWRGARRFRRFDALLGPLNFSEAVRRLPALPAAPVPAGNARPAGDPGARRAESAGLSFDGLGDGHERRPVAAAARPNPLLPADVAARGGASHASAEVELDFARRVHARLAQAAPEVRFSGMLGRR